MDCAAPASSPHDHNSSVRTLVMNPMSSRTTSNVRLSAAPLSARGKSIKEEIAALAGETGADFIHADGEARLDVGIFTEQLLVHVFYPLCVPYLHYRYGPTAPKNQLFIGKGQSWLFFVVQNLYWVMPIIYLAYRSELNTGGISDAEFSAVMFGGLVYRAVVSLKYGSLTRAEYNRYLKEADPKVSERLRTQLQLVSGWMNLELPRMIHEAELAFARLGLYRDEGSIPKFYIPRDELPQWAEMVGEYGYMLDGSPTECCESVGIEATDLMGMAYCSAQKKVCDMRVVRGLSLAFIALLALLPNLVRSRCLWLSTFASSDGKENGHLCPSTGFFGTGALANTFSALNVVLAASYAVPLTLFFATLLVANMRLFSCCQLYGRLVRSDVRVLPDYAALDFTVPSNILAWIRSLQGLHHFGLRYTSRMDHYSKMCAVLLVGLLAMLFARGFQLAVYEKDAADTMFVDVRYWVTFYLLIVWGSAFAMALATMAANNKETLRHELEFLQRRIRVREIRQRQLSAKLIGSDGGGIGLGGSGGGGGAGNIEVVRVSVAAAKGGQDTTLRKIWSEDQFDEIDDLLDTAVKVIEAQLRVVPHRFLNQNGSWGLFSQYVTLWITTIGITLAIAGINVAV